MNDTLTLPRNAVDTIVDLGDTSDTSDTVSTVDTASEQFVALVDVGSADHTTLEAARIAADRGAVVTVLAVLTDAAYDGVAQFAAAEDIDFGTAEAVTIDRLFADLRDDFPEPHRVELVDAYGTRHPLQRVLTSLQVDTATHIAVPHEVTSERGWSRTARAIANPLLIAAA